MFLGDYHTHTVYSHGKGTVEENVLAAIRRGLKEIAITDHGFHHMTYNVRKIDWKFIMADVELMRKKYPMIKILLGLETNILSASGNIDITASDMPFLDLVVCGYHKFIMPDTLSDNLGFFMPNFVLSTLGRESKRQKRKNTDAYIKALEKFDIDVISHVNNDCAVYVSEVAKAAANYGTFIEINNKNIKAKTGLASCPDDGWREILEKTDVEFIVDSDAHRVEHVGVVTRAEALVDRVGIPRERIANWDRLPVFRSHKAKEELLSQGKRFVGTESNEK